MRKRQIKKTVITYQEEKPHKQKDQSLERSRQKPPKVQVIDAGSRRARLAQLRNKQTQQVAEIKLQPNQPTINVAMNISTEQHNKNQAGKQARIQNTQNPGIKLQEQRSGKEVRKQEEQKQSEQQNSEQQQNRRMLKPVYLSKQDREEHIQKSMMQHQQQKERKKKALRYTTKLLLLENAKENENDEEFQHSSGDDDFDNRTDLPDDNDQKEEELQYELWKVRELKRVRRDREERRKIQQEKAEIERRRKMNNQEILLENKVMGSDATDNLNQTKYVYMQKYYHKGAFYQDSQDAIFKRDYNLPTPLQMQDKSMLPQILQKRAGNFGKKGQSKYKHLTAEDTTNFDPLYRQDESILNNWKKKTAGYKGSSGSNI